MKGGGRWPASAASTLRRFSSTNSASELSETTIERSVAVKLAERVECQGEFPGPVSGRDDDGEPRHSASRGQSPTRSAVPSTDRRDGSAGARSRGPVKPFFAPDQAPGHAAGIGPCPAATSTSRTAFGPQRTQRMAGRGGACSGRAHRATKTDADFLDAIGRERPDGKGELPGPGPVPRRRRGRSAGVRAMRSAAAPADHIAHRTGGRKSVGNEFARPQAAAQAHRLGVEVEQLYDVPPLRVALTIVQDGAKCLRIGDTEIVLQDEREKARHCRPGGPRFFDGRNRRRSRPRSGCVSATGGSDAVILLVDGRIIQPQTLDEIGLQPD